MFTCLARNRKRGVLALTFGLTMILIVFATLTAYLLALAAGGIRVENSHNEAQALYSAESGVDIALQTGRSGTWTGAVGRGRYAVRVDAGTITAVGEVPRATGAPLRCAVTVATRDGRFVRGSWRQAPPGRETALIAALEGMSGATEMLVRPVEGRR
jgi:hypothetical protein